MEQIYGNVYFIMLLKINKYLLSIIYTNVLTFSVSFTDCSSKIWYYLDDVGNCKVDGFGLYPYMKIDPITRAAPTENCRDMLNPNRNTDTMHVIMIARDVANPFKMLSAYFTTTATRSPPIAFNMTR